MANKIQEKYKKVMDEYQRVEFKLSPWHKPTPVNLPNNLNSGNPCQYKGVSMMQAHAGMDIAPPNLMRSFPI